MQEGKSEPIVSTTSSGRTSAQATVPADVTEFVHQVAVRWDRHLGERLAGIYLVGSLAHGGYSARYSDIDMALIAEQPLTAAEHDRLKEEAVQRSAGLAARLSLFWADAQFAAGRFPLLDRTDYLDHAAVLLERRHVVPERPTLTEVQTYLRGEPLDKWSRQVARLAALEDLTREDCKPYLRALLYPARFLYSWDTGTVASNDDAVAYVHSRNLFGADIDLLLRALRCRNDGDDPASLFSERRS